MIAFAVSLVLLLVTIAHVENVVLTEGPVNDWCVEQVATDSVLRWFAGFGVFVLLPLMTGAGALIALAVAFTTL